MADIKPAREPRGASSARRPSNGAAGAGRPQRARATPRQPEPSGHTRGFGTVLRNRYFLRLWMAQLLSQTIMNAANYGLIVLIQTRSKSYLATSLAIVAFALPAAIFGAPAGVLVDRLDRRRVLWVSNVLRGIAAIIFAISLLVDQHAIIPAYALSFFIAMVGQFFAPAEGAAIPLLVHRDELINALSLFNITFTLAQALGLIALGPLLLLLMPSITIGTVHHNVVVQPIESLFVIVAVLYVVCSLLILSIPVRRLKMQQQPGQRKSRVSETRQIYSIWLGVLECWHFIRIDRRLLISVIQLCIGGLVVAVVAMIAPGFVQEFFHRPPELAAMVLVPAGVGLVLGSAATPRIVRRYQYGRTILVGVIMLSACSVLLTVVRGISQRLIPHWWNWWPYLIVAILLTFLVGISLDFINVPAQTIMQQRSPDWIKGRVLAVQGMGLNIATVIFVPAMGLAADTFGIAPAMDILGVTIAVTGLATIYLSSRANRSENPGRPGNGRVKLIR
ncbi:MAG TPA: MFS transporter [Ktedonobacterales bacterium]